MDRFTSVKRDSGDVDGKARDRFMMIMLIFCSWHLFSSWRRSPFSPQPSSSSILIEEVLLMSLSIVLAVWSISKKGKLKYFRIFNNKIVSNYIINKTLDIDTKIKYAWK